MPAAVRVPAAAAAVAQPDPDDNDDFDDIPDLRAELEEAMALEEPEPQQPANPDGLDVNGGVEPTMCPAGQCIFMMFRSKVFRRQEESGHFPPMRFYPRRLNLRRFPREIKRELVTIYNVRGRNSPSRCVEMGKRLGILPIEICDFYLNRRYPELKHVLRAEELRRERARANNEPDRTFFFNVFAGFKLQVTFRDLEDDSDDEPAPRAPRAVAPRAQPRAQPAPEVAAAPLRRRGRPARIQPVARQ